MPELLKLTTKDFKTDQEVRWCPGCGDYAILAAVQGFMPSLGIARENIVFVSGIGCSSRFPYYMNTYGMHSIHGRAPAIATGLAASRPDLSVWVVTGDGDALSIGGNHLIHALRRNVNLKILLFNNRIYGLTKGQYSPTSEQGKITKSTPYGSLDAPFNPVSLALGAEATFVARTIDSDRKHLTSVLQAAAEHEGTALIEIYQNCNIFNDGAFENLKDNSVRDRHLIRLEHGQPIVFGSADIGHSGSADIGHSGSADIGHSGSADIGNSGSEDGRYGIVRMPDATLKVVPLEQAGDSVLIHDAHAPEPDLAFALSRLPDPATLSPTPIGVFRDVARPTYDKLMAEQLDEAARKLGSGKLADLLTGSDTWTIA